jgi:hypothetical protein
LAGAAERRVGDEALRQGVGTCAWWIHPNSHMGVDANRLREQVYQRVVDACVLDPN